MNLSKNTLLLDVDGVMLNWVDGFNDWIHKYHMKEHAHLNFKKDNVKDDVYCISERYGIPKDIIFYYVKLFNNSLDFGYLKAIPDARRAVTWFAYNDWNIHTVSSYSNSDRARDTRLKNIEAQFSPKIAYTRHHQLDLDETKTSVLKHYKDNITVFIDDKPENVEDALNLDMEAYLFDQPHNKSSTLDRITWEELLERYK